MGEVTANYLSDNDTNERPRLFSGDTSQHLPPMTSATNEEQNEYGQHYVKYQNEMENIDSVHNIQQEDGKTADFE